MSAILREAGAQAKLQVEDNIRATALDAPIKFDRNAEDPRIHRPQIFSILDYIEQPWGLGMNLYPVQRFIVKLYYFLPLDSKQKTIRVTDMFNTRTLYDFTEVEYLRFLHEEGRCNIGVQDHNRRDLLLALGRRAGKCCARGTLVPTNRGIFPIEELGAAPVEDATPAHIGIAQEAGRRATATAFYNGGVKPTFAIKTDSGYTLAGTKNHRVKVMTSSGNVEWRYHDDVRVGDFVAINRTSDIWATEYLDLTPYHNDAGYKDVALPVTLDETLGNFIGYLVGDGTWGDGHAVAVTVEHPETWLHLRGLFVHHFGEPRVQMDKRTANTGRLVCSVRARRFLDALGWKLGTARDEKMVPWAILRSPRSVICAFLRGLFETDGSAESGGRHITFSSASFRLAHEVQVLLLNLGIVSHVSRKWCAQTEKHYANLSLKGVRSRRRFAELVGFDSDKKRLPMLEALECAQEGKSDTESIPHQRQHVRDWLESFPKRFPKRGADGKERLALRNALGNSPKPSGEDLSYMLLKRALDTVAQFSPSPKTAHFEEIARLDYFYDPVVSIEHREDQVYDLTVPDGESFVANGMTNHNTTLSGIFASYEVYRLLNLSNPQEFYGLPNGNRIQIVSIATDKDQAGLLFNEVTGHLAKCEYFKPFIANNTLSHIQFRTPYDIEKYGPTARHQDGKFVSFNGKATMRVTFKSCIAKGLRGSGNVVVILDEMAHFQDKGNSSAKEIYDAVTPSAAAFSPKNPANPAEPIGPVESRIICISSPLNKQGKFYDLYHLAMTKGQGSENLLALQGPTWEVNPTIESGYYRRKYHEDPAVFMTEHGAQFSDRVRGWLERSSDLLACVDPKARPVRQGKPRYPHQMGIDIGLIGDGSTISITHVNGDKIVLDYHEAWYAGVDWRETNPHLDSDYPTEYARHLPEVERLDFDEIAQWIVALSKRFYISDALFDRWNGIPLEQALVKKGLRQFKSEFFTRDTTSKMYQACKMLLFDERLSLYDWPIEGIKHSPLITELLDLQAQQLSKNIIVVSATAGNHDDMSDSLIRAVWLSAQAMSNPKHLLGASPSGAATTPMSAARYQLQRARMHGGYGDRTLPRQMGLRLRPR